MSTEEGNLLIAKFMSPYFATDVDDYHKDWYWLMPVITKINLVFEKGIEQEYGRELWQEIHDMLSKLSIERTWLAIVKFIQWQNEQKED